MRKAVRKAVESGVRKTVTTAVVKALGEADMFARMVAVLNTVNDCKLSQIHS